MRRRLSCPDCRATLIITSAAAERGRMRCPECETVIDVPDESEDRRDDYDDRPRRRRKTSGPAALLWVLLGGAAVLLLVCGGGIYLMVRLFDSGARESPVPLMQARAGFQTNIVNPQQIATGPALAPPADKLQVVRYNSAVGPLVAYLTLAPRDERKHPAVVWARPSFGGIGANEWEDNSPPMIFARAGFVVLCPSWRGENDNPGKHEQFFGEVDDAVAAIDYVAALPYVNPSRIYMVGESEGGTLTLLTVEATTKLRAAFTLGGSPDFGKDLGPFGAFADGDTPFNPRDKKEKRLRSAIDFIHHVRTPTFYIDGSDSGESLEDAQKMEERARKAGAPVSVLILEERHEITTSVCKFIAAKIKADAEGSAGISITVTELQKAYDAGP
jgi:dienelactone hydrolase